MSTEKLLAALQQIKSLADDALQNAGGLTARKKQAPRTSTAAEARSRNVLPAQLLQLRDKGFFHPPKTAVETHTKLQESYHCELNRVVTALLRLRRRKQLRKASKLVGKKRQLAYVW